MTGCHALWCLISVHTVCLGIFKVTLVIIMGKTTKPRICTCMYAQFRQRTVTSVICTGIIIIIIIIIVRLSLLTMTNLNHTREMLLFVCSKIAD